MPATTRPPSERSDHSPERELALLLVGTREARDADRDRTLELAPASDPEALAGILAGDGLLALVGTRLLELAPELVPAGFAARVAEAVARGRRRVLAQRHVTLRLASTLEQADIPTLPLKGVTLAEVIYGDPALRPSVDIDLLVHPSDLRRAVGELSRSGYELARGDLESDRLPPLHYTLAPRKRWLPQVELHWRVHWYEEELSPAILRRSRRDAAGVRRAEPADELAMLLLFFARDGFVGLRYAADIAAWWDQFGASLLPGALDALADRHSPLRRPLTVAGVQAERLVGVPVREMLSLPPALDRRSRLAVRLANWSSEGDPNQMASNRVLVDWLLSPRGGQRQFGRRFLLRSAGSYERAPAERRPPWPVWTATQAPKVLLRFLYALWRVRGGRDWAPVPPRGGAESSGSTSAWTGRTPASRATST